MAITAGNWSSSNQIGTLTFNPNADLGTLAVGDVLFMMVETANQAVSLNTAGGFIEIGQFGTGTAGGTTATRMALYYQQVTSLPISTSCQVADAGDHITVGVMVVSGCINDGGQPFLDPVWKINSTASTTANWDAADNPYNNSAVLLFGVDGVDSATETMQTVTNSVVGAITTSNSASPSSTGFSWAHSLSGNGGQIVAAFKVLPTSPGSTGTSTAPHTSFVSVTATMVLLTERTIPVPASEAGSGSDTSRVSPAAADSGSASDPRPVPTVSQPATETAAASEPTPAISVKPAEATAAADTATVIVQASESAGGADVGGGLHSPAVNDVGAFADAAQSSSSVQVSDIATAADSVTAITVKPMDGATGGDTVVPMDVDLSGSEASTASDSASVLFKGTPDPAAGADSATVTARTAEAATGLDSAQLSVAQFVADTATATDSASVIVYAAADTSVCSQSAFIFIEGVGVIGARVVRIPDEARVMMCARAIRGGVKLIPGESRIRLLGKESRTVKVVPHPRTRTVPRTEV